MTVRGRRGACGMGVMDGDVRAFRAMTRYRANSG